MSGIEALHWTQMYPDEVMTIIGLDMAVPESYEDGWRTLQKNYIENAEN